MISRSLTPCSWPAARHRFWPDEWPELYAATAPQYNYVGVPSPILASTVLDPDGVDLASRPGGLSAAQIASQLSSPASPVARAVDGSAQAIIAAIDQVLHIQTARS